NVHDVCKANGRPAVLLTLPTPIHYADAWLLQQQLHADRVHDRRCDTLLLLEHQPVYTMGRRTALSHLPYGEPALRASGAAIERVNRGGSVTYHGPGQLIGYPILKLSTFAAGPKEYVWLLEETLMRAVACWGIRGYRISKQPGLFAGPSHAGAKLASIGVRVERGVTLHGFSLNVDLDLTPFSSILACGIEGGRATSMAAVRQSSVPIELVAQQVSDQFEQVFHVSWRDGSLLQSVEKEQCADA
ncbi:MAG TPA: lipoyl(octanoyl) transferase LipB, partial [Nitrospira sp.]